LNAPEEQIATPATEDQQQQVEVALQQVC